MGVASIRSDRHRRPARRGFGARVAQHFVASELEPLRRRRRARRGRPLHNSRLDGWERQGGQGHPQGRRKEVRSNRVDSTRLCSSGGSGASVRPPRPATSSSPTPSSCRRFATTPPDPKARGRQVPSKSASCIVPIAVQATFPSNLCRNGRAWLCTRSDRRGVRQAGTFILGDGSRCGCINLWFCRAAYAKCGNLTGTVSRCWVWPCCEALLMHTVGQVKTVLIEGFPLSAGIGLA